MRLTVVDVGSGNLGSIHNMIRRIGAEAEVTVDAEKVAGADRLVLPGVGSFDSAVQGIAASDGLREALDAAVARGVPLLGICLGMQLLSEGSEEGELPGLGYVRGRCVRFPETADGKPLRVPHMGWATLEPAKEDPVVAGLDDDSRFYFAHSFHLVPADEGDVLARATYGVPFVAAVRRGNIWGVQFHPEKSHRHGLEVLAAFLTA